jgi:ADP-ribose pyrophosphatase
VFKMKLKIISEKINYKGSWAKVREVSLMLPDGKTTKWEDIISNDAVAIVALDRENNVYLSQEWRSAWKKEILQIPAGMCKRNTEKGALKQAKEELAEELGFGARKWEKLITYLLGGRQKSKIHVFLARDLYESKKEPDEGEIIKVVKMSLVKSRDIFLSGKKETTSYTVIGLALAKDKLK